MKPRGATPMIVKAALRTTMVLPSTSQRPPNRRCQKLWLTMATGAAVRSSSVVKTRPLAAPQPSHYELTAGDQSSGHFFRYAIVDADLPGIEAALRGHHSREAFGVIPQLLEFFVDLSRFRMPSTRPVHDPESSGLDSITSCSGF